MSVLDNRRLGWLGEAAAGVIAAPASLIPHTHAQEQLWIRQFGTSRYESAYALAPDGAGGATVAGQTEGDLGGPIAGLGDAFLARHAIGACLCACDWDGDPACTFFDFLFFQKRVRHRGSIDPSAVGPQAGMSRDAQPAACPSGHAAHEKGNTT